MVSRASGSRRRSDDRARLWRRRGGAPDAHGRRAQARARGRGPERPRDGDGAGMVREALHLRRRRRGRRPRLAHARRRLQAVDVPPAGPPLHHVHPGAAIRRRRRCALQVEHRLDRGGQARAVDRRRRWRRRRVRTTRRRRGDDGRGRLRVRPKRVGRRRRRAHLLHRARRAELGEPAREQGGRHARKTDSAGRGHLLERRTHTAASCARTRKGAARPSPVTRAVDEFGAL
mmetsp:Transcript_12534/g.41848  ORF Transcript_12534/g.41848 Transcript_12534/m.41848 type:complete len:231 (+) Transcript_12534:586-1278(+)